MIVKVISMSLWEICRQHNIRGLVWDTQSEPREEEQSSLILTIKFIFPKRKQKGHVLFSHLLFQKSEKCEKLFKLLGAAFFLIFYFVLDGLSELSPYSILKGIYKRMSSEINNLFSMIVKGCFNQEGEYETESDDLVSDFPADLLLRC